MVDTDTNVADESQEDVEVNTPGDDNVSVVVAPPDVTVNVEVTPDAPEDPPTTPEADLSSMVGTAVTAALAPLVESVNGLTERVSVLEERSSTAPQELDEVPPVVVEEETVTEDDHSESDDENHEGEDAPPKSRRDHWFFRDHDVPLLHKTGS